MESLGNIGAVGQGCLNLSVLGFQGVFRAAAGGVGVAGCGGGAAPKSGGQTEQSHGRHSPFHTLHKSEEAWEYLLMCSASCSSSS